jgi:NNP family nitrate/nitrite transporter-like MFS transporter
MKGFLRAGHFPTLLASLLYFDVSFMAWILLGPLAPFLREELGLSATTQGLITAIPLLGGSLFRPLLGAVSERIGGRRTGLIGLAITATTLAGAWLVAETPAHFMFIGLMLGIAGASFAVALPLASRWYPPEYQGVALGIAGAGNSGTLLATLFAPRLAESFGWQATFGIAILPLAAVFVLFALIARDSPRPIAPATLRDYRAVLSESDTLSLSWLYSLTFGGFVGFASFLTTFFHEAYHVSRVDAGDLTTVVVVAGSVLRPIGGWLSDRVGGYRILVLLLASVGACLTVVAFMPRLSVAVAMLFFATGLLGMGNGAVFQLVPQRFPDRIGIVTGVIGAAGGLGGFFLPFALGAVRDATGSYGAGLFGCAATFLVGTLVLLELGTRWSQRWDSAVVQRTGLYSYRGAFAEADDESVA